MSKLKITEIILLAISALTMAAKSVIKFVVQIAKLRDIPIVGTA